MRRTPLHDIEYHAALVQLATIWASEELDEYELDLLIQTIELVRTLRKRAGVRLDSESQTDLRSFDYLDD